MLVRDILEIKSAHAGECQIYGVSADSTMAEAIRMMRMHDIGSVVVYRSERFVGLVTLREVLAALDRCGGEALPMIVTDIMNPQPVVGSLSDSIDHVRQMMTEHHISHLPIMVKESLVDIISLQDVAKAAHRECQFENQLLKHYIVNWPEEAETAGA